MNALLQSKHFVKIVAVLITLIVVLGAKAVKSHLTTIKDEIQSTVRGATSAEYEVERIRNLIEDMSRDVLEFDRKIAEIQTVADGHKADAGKLSKTIDADRKDLLTERELISSGKETFAIRGVAYSRQQILASAEARMAQIARDEATLNAKRQMIHGLEEEIGKGKSDLRAALALRDEKCQELEMLSAQMANVEMRSEMAALTDSLNAGVFSRSRNELSKSLKQFRQRVKMKERTLDAASQTRSAPAIITHESPSRPGLLEEIDRVLGVQSTPVAVEIVDGAEATETETIQH